MSQLTISMPDDLAEKIRFAAEDGNYSSVSAFITEVVRAHLNSGGPTYWERVNLSVGLANNRILATLLGGKQLLKAEEWDYSKADAALKEGYEYEYDQIFQDVYRDEMSSAESKFVYNVLAMYDDLQWSAEHTKDTKLIDSVLFPGFDGNRDVNCLGYLRYLRENRLFAHVKLASGDGNSHGLNPGYNAMLARYNAVRASTEGRHVLLSPDEIKQVLNR